MKSPYFRSNLDLAVCRLGSVLTIHWLHRLAGLVTKARAAPGPTTWEVLVAAMAHNSFTLLDALSRITAGCRALYRAVGAGFGRKKAGDRLNSQ